MEIPNEIILEIVEKLKAKDTKNLSMTCKKYLFIFNDNKIWDIYLNKYFWDDDTKKYYNEHKSSYEIFKKIRICKSIFNNKKCKIIIKNKEICEICEFFNSNKKLFENVTMIEYKYGVYIECNYNLIIIQRDGELCSYGFVDGISYLNRVIKREEIKELTIFLKRYCEVIGIRYT